MNTAIRVCVILVVAVVCIARDDVMAQESTEAPKTSAGAKGSTEVGLSSVQPGKDLSEFQDSFWRLTKLQASDANLSGVIIQIGQQDISFSTVSYFASYPFGHNLSGLKLFPAWRHSSSKSEQSGQDQQLAKLFSDSLCKTRSYDFAQGTLTFFGNDQQPMIVLTSLQQQGIENRKWRIAKYRRGGSMHGDDEGLINATEPADITFVHGRVDGSPGCGAWVGTYRLSGDHLIVEAQWILAGLCHSAGFAQDGLVESAFKGELRIDEKKDHILLRDMSGKARILLTSR